MKYYCSGRPERCRHTLRGKSKDTVCIETFFCLLDELGGVMCDYIVLVQYVSQKKMIACCIYSDGSRHIVSKPDSHNL